MCEQMTYSNDILKTIRMNQRFTHLNCKEDILWGPVGFGMSMPATIKS